jgi:hypothetical protein
MKNRNSRMREIAFHTLFCMVSTVSILLTMQKKYTSENDPLEAQITMREFQFFESIIEKILFIFRGRRCFCAFKGLYCLDLRLGVKDLFMHKKHSLRALNIKITIAIYLTMSI